MGDEKEFDALLASAVANVAPRMFAIVQEYGERVDFHIAGWGIAFDDHALAISNDRSASFKLGAAEDVLRAFRRGEHVGSRLIWTNPRSVN